MILPGSDSSSLSIELYDSACCRVVASFSAVDRNCESCPLFLSLPESRLSGFFSVVTTCLGTSWFMAAILVDVLSANFVEAVLKAVLKQSPSNRCTELDPRSKDDTDWSPEVSIHVGEDRLQGLSEVILPLISWTGNVFRLS